MCACVHFIYFPLLSQLIIATSATKIEHTPVGCFVRNYNFTWKYCNIVSTLKSKKYIHLRDFFNDNQKNLNRREHLNIISLRRSAKRFSFSALGRLQKVQKPQTHQNKIKNRLLLHQGPICTTTLHNAKNAVIKIYLQENAEGLNTQ